ncbi:hypothetical protein [Nonomuraea sp. SBT364]|uniref:hypothetical protein n=1 Tax=Nonomuraea sp. SBT364 TaxID=1580530 RepID=UPI00066A52C7|nr:hypothetical protein [Nonomuraea sp. SBT364]
MASRAWLVRLGETGQRESTALEKGQAILGWSNLGDLSACRDRTDIAALLHEAYQGEGPSPSAGSPGRTSTKARRSPVSVR